MGDFGPFEDAVMGAPLDTNNYHAQHNDGYGNHDPLFSYDVGHGGGGGKQKKNKKKDSHDQHEQFVEVVYEGYALEPALGSKKNDWSQKIGKAPLYWGSEKLRQTVKNRRPTIRDDVKRDFEALDEIYQTVINRVIAERMLEEKDKNAEWILRDVKKFPESSFLSFNRQKEVTKLEIIIRRQDRVSKKERAAIARRKSKASQYTDIIDMTEPIRQKKGKGGKKDKQNKGHEDYYPQDDHYGANGDDYGQPMLPLHQDHHNDYQYHQQPQHQPMPVHDPYAHLNNAPLPPAPMPPYEQHNQYSQPQYPQPQYPQPQYQPDLMQPQFTNPNPFDPHPHLAAPAHYDNPIGDHDDDDYYAPAPELNPRKSSLKRRQSNNVSSDARRISKEVDRFEDLVHGLTQQLRINDGGSSEETYGGHGSTWSRGEDRDLSSRSSYSPRRSLERSKSRHDHRSRPRYRSKRHSDSEMSPAYTHRGRDDRYHYEREPSRRRASGSGRPPLYHAHTYDDYPTGRGGGEPRFLPPISRRLTDYAEPYDYQVDEQFRRGSGWEGDRDGRPRSRGGFYPGSYDDGYAREYHRTDRPRRGSVGGGGAGRGNYYR